MIRVEIDQFIFEEHNDNLLISDRRSGMKLEIPGDVLDQVVKIIRAAMR